MNSKSAIAKGKILEDYVAGRIRELGLDNKATRSHGSGSTNTEKSDIWTSMQILGQNIGIECKNQKNIKLKDWWKQTQKLESLGREPVLCLKLPQDSLENTLCVIYLETLLELARKAQNEPNTICVEAEDTRERRWAIENLKNAVNKVLKYL